MLDTLSANDWDMLDQCLDDRHRLPVLVAHHDGVAADALDERGHVGGAEPLPKQHQVSFPMSELGALRHSLGPEQDADIAMEFRRTALAGASRAAGLAKGRQIPPELFTQAFLGVAVAMMVSWQTRSGARSMRNRPAICSGVQRSLIRSTT